MPSLEAPRRISELEAVNIILRNSGEDPVTTLGPNAKPTAQKAKEMLAEESIRIQTEGYNFNRETLTLEPAGVNHEIALPINILAFEPTEESRYRTLQEDDTRLYDADANSFRFDGPVVIDAVLGKPFAKLPQAARWYIAISTALRFANSENPGGASLRLTVEDLEAAKTSLEKYDRRLKKGGLRWNNAFIRRMRGNR